MAADEVRDCLSSSPSALLARRPKRQDEGVAAVEARLLPDLRPVEPASDAPLPGAPVTPGSSIGDVKREEGRLLSTGCPLLL
jgi:hypothetical protein